MNRSSPPSSPRRDFRVHARNSHHARLISEASFEAAAVAYVEEFADLAWDEAAMRVVVRDVASGREHCFTIDLEAGETAPCP